MLLMSALAVFLPFIPVPFDWGLKVEQRTSMNSDQGHLHRLRFQGEPWAGKELSSHWSLKTEVRGWIDPGVMPSTHYADQIEEDEGYGLQLRKAYAEYRNLPFSLRVGVQEIVWGEALHFFSADILHPKDYRDGFLNSLSWARRPQTGIHFQWDDGQWSAQFVYFPFSMINRYPRLGSDFFAARYDVESVGIPHPDEEGLFDFSKPTLAANFGLRAHGLDVHLLGAFMRDPQRYYRSGASGRYYTDRMVVSAVTASYTYEDFLGRFEFAWMPARRVNAYSGVFSDHRVGEINSIASMDYSGFENIILTANFHLNKKINCQLNQILPCQTHQEGAKFLWLNLPFQSEFESSAWVEFKDPSVWWSTSLRKALTDHLKASLSVEQFFGSGETLYAEWARSDQVVVSVEGQW